MECQYCHTHNRKFYCRRCLRDKLDSHNVELAPLEAERDKLVDEAAEYVKGSSRIRELWSKKQNSATNIEKATEERKRLNEECGTARRRIQQLRLEIEKRRSRLENVDRGHIEAAMADCAEDIQHTKKRWHKLHKSIVKARSVLVHETITLFEFKPGVVEDGNSSPAITATATSIEPRPTSSTSSSSSSTASPSLPFAQQRGSSSIPLQHSHQYHHHHHHHHHSQLQHHQQQQQPEDLYICGVTLPARVIDVSKYSKEELNAAIGHLIHMLGLITRYLGVKLPFPIFHKTIYPYIRSAIAKQRHSSKMPLFLDDKNLRRFTIGMAMLNYDIAYLCHSQGVEIQLPQVANSLQALMACCRSQRLGLRSHLSLYQSIRGVDFPLEFHQVLKVTAQRYQSGTPIITDLNRELVLNGLLLQTNSNNVMSNNNGSDDWYYYDGLLDNSEDDIQDDEEDEYDGDGIGGINSETWNLVDVMPSFGRPNGEGESIFQLGATIMPGVIGMSRNVLGNMMASGSSSSASQDHHNNNAGGSSNTSNNGGVQQQETRSEQQQTHLQLLQQYPYYYRRLSAAVKRNGLRISRPLL